MHDINENYYECYQLDVCLYSLTEREKEMLDMCVWIVNNHCSLRQCCKEFGDNISKSQLHRDIHSKLKRYSYELYQRVLRQLEQNKRR